MSVEALARVLNNTPPDVGGTRKLVLIGIANHANDDGEAWPSVATLARYAAVTEANVRRATTWLVGRGLIARSDRWRDNGSQSSNQYRILWDEFTPRAESRVPPARECATPPRATARGPRAVARDLEPSLEPSVEPSVENNNGAALVCDSPDSEFEDFWRRYPSRNGRKPGKRAAKKRWGDLGAGDRVLASEVVARYETFANGYPVDCERWLNRRSRGVNFTDHEDWVIERHLPQETEGQRNIREAVEALKGHGRRDGVVDTTATVR